MSDPKPGDVTQLLRELAGGNNDAANALLELVYDELHAIARAHFGRQRPDHTLQPTALIHEAYMKMVDSDQLVVHDRAHFYALASRIMRQILVDHCRRRIAAKRGGDWNRVTLSEAGPADSTSHDVIDLDAALSRLGELDARKSRVVELRFFGGLGVPDCAQILDVSPRTIETDWAMARAWLKKELE